MFPQPRSMCFQVRDEVAPSPRHQVGSACLRAMTSLAAHVTTKRQEVGRQLSAELRTRHAAAGRPHALRRTSLQCLLHLQSALHKRPGLVTAAVDLLEQGTRGGSAADGEAAEDSRAELPHTLQLAVLEAALEGLGVFETGDWDTEDLEV